MLLWSIRRCWTDTEHGHGSLTLVKFVCPGRQVASQVVQQSHYQCHVLVLSYALRLGIYVVPKRIIANDRKYKLQLKLCARHSRRRFVCMCIC